MKLKEIRKEKKLSVPESIKKTKKEIDKKEERTMLTVMGFNGNELNFRITGTVHQG